MKKENVNKIKATHLYKIFTNVIILDEIMRQQGEAEKEFRDVLTRLVNGKFDEKDWEWLRAQDFDAMDKEKQKEFKDNAVMLCSRNKDLKQHNIYKMKSLGNPIAPVKAVNNNSLAKEAEPSTAGGLHKIIIMAKGAKMVITRNLWKEAGLNNGTTCTVRYILYLEGRKPPELPVLVLVHCPQYRGPSFLPDEPNIVPIAPVLQQWYSRKQNCTRQMIPLMPAYAVTIHKAQGMSLDKVIINLGKDEYCNGLTYTALSRCKEIKNLALINFPPYTRIRNLQNSPTFIVRLNEDKYSRERQKVTIKKKKLPY